MISKKYIFAVMIFLSSVVMIFSDFMILIFFGYSFSSLIFRLGIPGLGFIVIYNIVLGRNAKCFSPAFFKDITGEQYLQRLKTLGSIPIKMIGLNAVIHFLFLGGVFFRGEYLGLEASVKWPLFVAALAFGMVMGTFIYVMSDGLVSRTLMSYKFSKYPRSLREHRQELKAFIIPLAILLISILFSYSVTMLGLTKAGINFSESHGGLSGIFIPLIVFFLVITILAFILKKNSSVLYSSIIEQLENLSSERKDLTKRVTVCSVDELGTIAGMVNTFSEYLSEGIRDIKGGQKELSDVGHRLETNASDMAASITQISGATEQVLAKTQGQMENVNTSSRTIHGIIENIKSLEESISIQSSSMSQASSAVEQMVGNISSIGVVTEKMAAQFRTVEDAAVKGSKIQKDSAVRISEIVTQSQTLQEANRIIATIAAQTNLLAMNAAIEAAHAGDAGRGFSVVADEIRKLAENSSVESQKISTELKQIVQTIGQIVKDAEASGAAFSDVSTRVNDTEKLVIEVDNAVREQKSGAGQVMESLRVMNELTSKVSAGSQEMSQGNETMLHEIGSLQASATEISTSMEEVSSGIRKINSGAQEVSGMAAVTQSSINKISVIADGFEV